MCKVNKTCFDCKFLSQEITTDKLFYCNGHDMFINKFNINPCSLFKRKVWWKLWL